MKKTLCVILSVLCLILIVNASVSAAYSFREGETHVTCVSCTVVDNNISEHLEDLPADVQSIVLAPTLAKIDAIPNVSIPSTKDYSVYFATGFFDVSDECFPYNHELEITVYHEKIIEGALIKAIHYSTKRSLWEEIDPYSIDRSAHTAVFRFQDGSPVALIIAIPKGGANTGVVDTATYH